MPFNLQYALKTCARWNGVAGTAWDAPSNLVRLNAARGLIYGRAGDWMGLDEWICLNAEAGCKAITLPEAYDHIKIAYEANGGSVVMSSNTHQVIDRATALRIVIRDRSMPVPVTLFDANKCRPYRDKPNGRFTIKLTNDNELDNGKVVNVTVASRGSESVLDMTLAGPEGVVADAYFDDIISVSKPNTSGGINVWGATARAAKFSLLMASYGPDVLEPYYREYKVNGCGCNHIVALARKKFIPITDLRKVVDVNSIDALKHGYMAINAQESNNIAEEAQHVSVIENYMDRADRSLEVAEASVPMNMGFSFLTGIQEYDY